MTSSNRPSLTLLGSSGSARRGLPQQIRSQAPERKALSATRGSPRRLEANTGTIHFLDTARQVEKDTRGHIAGKLGHIGFMPAAGDVNGMDPLFWASRANWAVSLVGQAHPA